MIKTTNKNMVRVITNLMILSIIGCIMVGFRVYMTGSLKFAFLIWNLFLAWIPLGFSLTMKWITVNIRNGTKKRIYLLFFGFLWLMFYPNAPYIITDIIHLGNYNYYSMRHNLYGNNASIIIWYDFILVMFFVFKGYIIGHISLFTVHKMVEKKFKKILGWIFVLTTSILSGYAIFLGRYIRINSWEIISNPLSLLKVLITNINLLSIKFTLSFGIFIFLLYIALNTLGFVKESKNS